MLSGQRTQVSNERVVRAPLLGLTVKTVRAVGRKVGRLGWG